MARNGWTEYKPLFNHIKDKVEQIDNKVDKLTERVAKIEVKSSLTYTLLGSLGGGIVVAVSLAIRAFM